MEKQKNVAKMMWNEAEQRFELRVLNKLKGHTKGETMAEHEVVKKTLVELATWNGYTVINVENKNGGDSDGI